MPDRPTIFPSGAMPSACHHGHLWDQPGTYLVGHRRCTCKGALGNGFGHAVVRCRGDGDTCRSVWTDPPCGYHPAGQA